MNADIPEDLVTMTEAARLARCSLNSLYRWLLQGKLSSWKRCGRRFVSRAELLGLFEEDRREPPAAPERRRRRDRETQEVLRRHGLA